MSTLDNQVQGTVYGTIRYGQGYYGRPLQLGNTPLPTFSAAPLTAEALDYATVSIRWSIPTLGSLLRLVQNNFGVSADQDDGAVLLEQALTSRPSYVQGDIPPDLGGQFIYYTLWNQDNAGVWWRAADVQTIFPKNWGYSARLWSYLPTYYQNLDIAQQGATL